MVSRKDTASEIMGTDLAKGRTRNEARNNDGPGGADDPPVPVSFLHGAHYGSQELPEPPIPVSETQVGSRLQKFWQNWEFYLEDPWVTDVLRHGYRFELVKSPPLTLEPVERLYSVEQGLILSEAIQSLVTKGAVRMIHPDHLNPGFYSQIFLVPKKGSSEFRMIHNLKEYLAPPPKFRMLTVKQLTMLVRQGDYLASLDLKDAYLHVPIHHSCHKYLRFVFQGRHYEWTALPFGISVAPWLFTRITRPIVGFLHNRGIRFESYIDDCLLLHQNRATLTSHLDFSCLFLRRLGWKLNLEKSDLNPNQNLQFIGCQFQTLRGRVFVPQDRWLRIQIMVTETLSCQQNVRFWQSLLGLLTSAQDLTLRGRLHLRELQIFLNPFLTLNPKRLIQVPERLKPRLEWWQNPSNVLSGVSFLPFSPSLHLHADASLVGWGATLGVMTAAGLWSDGERQLHINCLEFKAVILAISHWAQQVKDHQLMIATDNVTVAAYINKQGGTRSRSLLKLAYQFFELVDRIPVRVRARHIPGATNVLVDALSRPGKPSPTEWMLNRGVFQWVCNLLGTPHIDLFATHHNHQLPVYVSPVLDPQAYGIDALSIPWEGMMAYAYPPTALIPRVLQHFRLYHCKLILIAPWWPNRGWFPDLLELANPNPIRLPLRRDLLVHPRSRQFHQNLEIRILHA